MSILPFFNTHPYSFCERILRTAVFQQGAENDGVVEKTLLWLYKAFSAFTCSPDVFDNKRAERKLELFSELGAEIEFIFPIDGKAKIQTMHLRSDVLEKKIQTHGAQWEKITIVENDMDKDIFAIIPPVEKTIEWDEFEQKLLDLKWNKRKVQIKDGDIEEVIVTSENASAVNDDDCHRLLFLHVNPPDISFTMLTRRAGFHLGHKQNIFFYNSRGTFKSTGFPSKEGVCNDIDIVYEKVKEMYESANIWVTSSCGGMAAAAYLKLKVHKEGVNFIFESGYTDLTTDWVQPQGFIVSTFVYLFWSGLSSRDIPQRYKPHEVGYNIALLWKDLKLTDLGRIIVIAVENDQRLASKVDERLFDLVQKVNEQALHVRFLSKDANAHSDSYFKYPKPTAEVISYIYETTNGG